MTFVKNYFFLELERNAPEQEKFNRVGESKMDDDEMDSETMFDSDEIGFFDRLGIRMDDSLTRTFTAFVDFR